MILVNQANSPSLAELHSCSWRLFWISGRLATSIRATGEVEHSPYNTVPAIMLVLGGLMTNRHPTRVIIFTLGLLFFVAVHSLSVFGSARFPSPSHTFSTYYVFLS